MKNIPLINRTKLMQQVEQEHGGVKVEELLRIKYVDEGKTIQTISNELSVGFQTVLNWMAIAHITSRKLDV